MSKDPELERIKKELTALDQKAIDRRLSQIDDEGEVFLSELRRQGEYFADEEFSYGRDQLELESDEKASLDQGQP